MRLLRRAAVIALAVTAHATATSPQQYEPYTIIAGDDMAQMCGVVVYLPTFTPEWLIRWESMEVAADPEGPCLDEHACTGNDIAAFKVWIGILTCPESGPYWVVPGGRREWDPSSCRIISRVDGEGGDPCEMLECADDCFNSTLR